MPRKFLRKYFFLALCMVVKQEILRLKHFPEVGPPLDGSFRLLCARWGCKKENTYECQLKEGSLPVQKNIPA